MKNIIVMALGLAVLSIIIWLVRREANKNENFKKGKKVKWYKAR